MLYPPNMAALPHMAYPYPHYCNNPKPRFAENTAKREPSSRRRASSAFSATSAAAPSTPRKRFWCRQPKTPRPAREKEERTPISTYVIAALAGCSQYGVGFPALGGTANFTPATLHTPPRAEQRQRRQAAADPPTARFTEHIAEPEKVRGKRRERVRSCGRKVGSWIASLCSRDSTKEEHSRRWLQSEEGARHDDTHAGATNVTERKVSNSSEVTLVETVGYPGEEILVRTHTRVSPGRIYTGH
ncbi:hypothetical protein EV426DRAFT_710177 [Tirmania nivea]|nr:hypothetical protein EV426DRAFT_710177 [Tirmania nivea]